MLLGVDGSTYLDVLSRGGVFYDRDRPIDPLDALRANGVEGMRLRLWNDPRAPGGAPYLGGDCDLQTVLRLAHMAAGKGFRLMLDFHYSDFWTDPSKQTIPKGWAGLDLAGLAGAVYSFTRQTLETFRAEGLSLSHIQVGNEITNGMLWPVGRLVEKPGGGVREGYPALTRLLKAGCTACREVFPDAEIILHLERSGDGAVYQEFFSQMEGAGVDYDVIGASYYPYWHGPMERFFANMDECARFGKPRMVVETGYPFTEEDYVPGEDFLKAGKAAGYNYQPPCPMTPAGQAEFVERFLAQCRAHGLAGVFYWEPLWLPGEGSCWTSQEGQEYIGETGKPTRNEWANQCLFDYRGRKLPAFDRFCENRR